MEQDNAESPHITITIKDNNINWSSNLPLASMLYYLDAVKHLALTRSLLADAPNPEGSDNE